MGEGESNERTAEVKTSHPGRWAGVIKQFDGETGNLLDTSEIQLWVGQQGLDFSRLCIRTHKNGNKERMFVKGSLDSYDPQTGRFVAMASDKNFKWETQYRTERLSSATLRHKDAGKEIVVNGIVSFPNRNRKCTVRQLFLGNKLTIEEATEIKLGECPYMPCDPDAMYCQDPIHAENFPDGFSYDIPDPAEIFQSLDA